jgi:acetolactate synthase-1/2/3 large subunit
VLIDIPKDVQMSESPFVPTVLTPQPDRSRDLEEIEKAKQILGKAARPVLYAGGGVGLAGATATMRRFLEKTRMPSVTTLKGIGAIPADETLFMGMIGMHGSPAANKTVQGCDLLLHVDLDPMENVWPLVPPGASNDEMMEEQRR